MVYESEEKGGGRVGERRDDKGGRGRGGGHSKSEAAELKQTKQSSF